MRERGRGRRLMAVLRMGLRLVYRAAPRLLVLTSALQVVSGLAAVGAVLLGSRLADRLLRVPEEGAEGVVPLLAAFLVVTLVAMAASVVKAERQRLLAEASSQYATDEVLRAATGAELADYETPGFHDQMLRALSAAGSRPTQLSGALLGLVSASVTVVGLAIALLAVAPQLLALVLVGSVPLWWTARQATQLTYDFHKEQSERNRRRSYLMGALAARRWAGEIRVFGIGDEFRRRVHGLHDERIDDLRPVVRSRTALGLLGAAISVAIAGGVVLALVNLFESGSIGVEQAAVAVGSFLVISQRIQTLNSSAASVLETALFLEDLDEFSRFERAAPIGPRAEPIEHIELEDVGFTYPAGHEPAVTGIDLSLRRGEVVALVGENASGKTTLARLITLLYEPTTGAVRIDGVDAATLDVAAVRRRIAVVPQEYLQMMLTARENIVMGDLDAADDRARTEDAGRFADIHDAIVALPEGYDTFLGTEYTRGQEMSGGQWQRLAIARAWFRNADVIVFDEPTSALDPKAEVDLIERVRLLAGDKVVVLISHRFGTVSRADRIVVMHDGRKVEEGSHEVLVDQAGVYATLYRLQADTFG